jgi:hypothetical protein
MVIKVPIIVSYNNKGTKQATKGIGGLEKSFNKMGLASKFGYAAAGTAALAFAKKSIAAALADQKQQVVLAKTLANVGESFATASVTKYIDSLQRATGVSEDQLRPAFNKLVTATQSASEAQKLLALSLDISAATGKSSESVAAALSKAYLGNNTALSKLGVGLTKTELKSMTFEETTAKLSKLFEGQASATANTYAGQLAILGVAADEASETIGTALIESIAKLGGENGAKDLATQMQGLADSTANVIAGITIVLDYFKKLDASTPSWLKTIIGLLERYSPLGQAKEALKVLEQMGAKQKALQAAADAADTGNIMRGKEAADKAAKAALKNNKKIADSKKTIVTLTKAQAANEKLARMFDMDSIQLAAALQGKLSKEDEARVKALQALKTEDKNDDIKALDELEAAKRAATFAEIARLKSVVEESKKSNAEILADARSRIAGIEALIRSVGSGGGGSSVIPAPAPPLATVSNSVQSLIDSEMAIDRPFMPGDAGFTSNAPAAPTSLVVNVNPTGSGFIGNQDDFARAVQLALQIGNESGYSFDRAGS